MLQHRVSLQRMQLWLFSRKRFNSLDLLIAAVFGFFVQIFALWVYNIKPNLLGKVPLNTAGDGNLFEYYLLTFSQQNIIDVIANGLKSNFLGWPIFANLSYYPQNDFIHLYVITLISKLFSIEINYAITIYIVLKFGLVFVATYVIMRSLLISIFSSTLGSFLFTFLPFQFQRAEGHLALGQTWLIPLVLYPFLYHIFFKKSLGLKRLLIFGFLTGLAGVYYFLSTFILFVSLLVIRFVSILLNENLAILKQRLKSFFLEFQIYGFWVLSLLLSVSMQQFGSIRFVGQNPPIVSITDGRFEFESIIYSGNLLTLMLPIYEFVLNLAGKSANYASISNFSSGEAIGLGLVASILLIYIFTKYFSLVLHVVRTYSLSSITTNQRGVSPQLSARYLKNYSSLIFLILIFVAFYLSGGLGLLFAIFVTPSIRAWGRMSIIIGFLIIFTYAIILDHDNELKSKFRNTVNSILIVVLTLFTLHNSFLYNQVRPSSAQIISNYNSDNQYKDIFIKDLRDGFNNGCGIAFAPHYPFPEFDRPGDIWTDYEHLEIPLRDAGKHFKYTLGVVKYSPEDRIFRNLVSDKPPFVYADLATFLFYAYEAGACGIIIDTSSFAVSSEDKNNFDISKCKNIIKNKEQIINSKLSNYLVVDLQNDPCIKDNILSWKTQDIYKPSNQLIDWRSLTNPVEVYYNDVPMTSLQNSLSIELFNSNSEKILDKHQFRFNAVDKNLNESKNSYEYLLCVQAKDYEECFNKRLKNKEIFEIDLTRAQLNKFVINLRFTGENLDYSQDILHGIIPINEE